MKLETVSVVLLLVLLQEVSSERLWIKPAKLLRQSTRAKSDDWKSNSIPHRFRDAPEQKWNYVKVRENAFMFWWLYYTEAAPGYKDLPLVMWLQGGPGASSTGYGNFEEIGPLDVNLKPRPTTWLKKASLLFVDNPVGSGYSYVTSDDAYTTNNTQIADDLLTMMMAFLKEVPAFETIPFYIFCESYGGKMTADFAKVLYQAIEAGSINCNFKGVALGDSWISPLDSVFSWGPYLYATSLVDDVGLAAVLKSAEEGKAAFDAGNFSMATTLWGATENLITELTDGVNFYNILQWEDDDDKSSKIYADRFTHRHLARYAAGDLDTLMNTVIRKKLGIIPENVTWGGQSGKVFSKQAVDFMKPVISSVDYLLANTPLKVVVYSGQLDLIVDTMGTERWVQCLKWSDLEAYNNATRQPLLNPQSSHPWGYLKEYGNFHFFWILDAGHMVPADAGVAALTMLEMVIGDSDI